MISLIVTSKHSGTHYFIYIPTPYHHCSSAYTHGLVRTCPPATKGRAWYPPWWALFAPEPGVKGSPPLSVKTNCPASLLRLLYSRSHLTAREDEVTCKCVALVSKSGSLWQAKGCNVVSVSTGWGLFHYLTLLLQLLLIQAGLEFYFPKWWPSALT